MYKIVITTQLSFALLFSFALVATFTEAENIKERSRVQITEKVVGMVGSKIDLAEEVMNSKKVETYLADYQIEVINSEIASFRANPQSYIEQMTQDKTEVSSNEVETNNPLAKVLIEKVFGWKNNIKNHFDNTFSKLLTDLRIFCVTNVVGLFLAALVLFKREDYGKYSTTVSVILSDVIALSALSYFDQSWLYSILLNNYAGYGYPLGIISTFCWLFYEYHKSKEEA